MANCLFISVDLYVRSENGYGHAIISAFSVCLCIERICAVSLRYVPAILLLFVIILGNYLAGGVTTQVLDMPLPYRFMDIHADGFVETLAEKHDE